MKITKKKKIFILCIIAIIIGSILIHNFMNQYNETVLGQNENGTVYKIIAGNPLSSDTVCLILGVHSREHEIHESINKTISDITSFSGTKDLSKKYVIYYIKLDDNITSKYDTRPAGEILANQFIVKDIKNENPFIVIDIHEIDKTYEYSNFIYSVSNNSKSQDYAKTLANKINIANYYFKEGTSPQYVTEPIAAQDINTLLLEVDILSNVDEKRELSKKLIYALDNLNP